MATGSRGDERIKTESENPLIVTDEQRLEVTRLAVEAGREIMRIYRSGSWSVTEKIDLSPVTEADLAANLILEPGLKSLNIAPVISEESSPLLQESSVNEARLRDQSAKFWLVDPLDGTRDFIKRLDTFVVSIGLIRGIEPIFGLIHAPVTGETWWAQRSQGAYGPSSQRLYNKMTRKKLVVSGSRSHPSAKMNAFYNLFDVGEIRRMGSALKFCKLAEGEIDLYPRFGLTSEWDTAAGQVIAEEAGCKIIDLSTNQPLIYGKPNFLNSNGFMASRGDLDPVSIVNNSGLRQR